MTVHCIHRNTTVIILIIIIIIVVVVVVIIIIISNRFLLFHLLTNGLDILVSQYLLGSEQRNHLINKENITNQLYTGKKHVVILIIVHDPYKDTHE